MDSGLNSLEYWDYSVELECLSGPEGTVCVDVTVQWINLIVLLLGTDNFQILRICFIR